MLFQKKRSVHLSKRLSNTLRLVATIAIFALAILIVNNRQYIQDWLTVQNFTPSSQMKDIVERTKLTDKGEFYLYASRGELNEKSAFNTHCSRRIEKTAVLGCYANGRIYIYNIADERLDGVREVTTAHEMLHAAYDRLSQDEKNRVNRLIESQTATINDDKLADRLALYEQTEPGERLNELHSIIGTEITDISPELRSYYEQYFEDRNAIVALSNAYDSVFRNLESQQQELIAELETSAQSINQAMEQYKDDSTQLAADIQSFNNRAQSGDFESQVEFTRERAALLTQQTQLESDRAAINERIEQFNSQKAELEKVNITAQELQRSIDSNAAPETPAL